MSIADLTILAATGAGARNMRGGDPVLPDHQGLVQSGPALGDGHGSKPALALRRGLAGA